MATIIPIKEVEKRYVEILEILEEGGTILYPTDTVPGLGTYSSSEAGIEKINMIKNRPVTKPLSFLFRDVKMLESYCEIPPNLKDNLSTILPGPFTFIFKIHQGVIMNGINKVDQSVGIRIIEVKGLEKLLTNISEPLASTSANLSRQLPAQRFSDIPDSIINNVEICITWEYPLGNQPSTIIDFTKTSPVIVRRGEGNPEMILSGFNQVDEKSKYYPP